MRRTFFAFTHFALVLFATSVSARAQSLTCQAGTTAPDAACKVFHYHVQVWRPDTRALTEVYGTPQYATVESCERARSARQAANQQVADHFKALKKENAFTPSRYGTCHCDLTADRSSPNYLDDVKRAQQTRAFADALGRQRERLLDRGLDSSSPLVRGLFIPPMSASIFDGRRVVALPDKAPIVSSPTIGLKDTKIGSDSGSAASLAVNLPLAEISGVPAPVVAQEPPSPAPAVRTEPPPAPQPEPASPESIAAELPETVVDEADFAFVNYEMARVQQFLAAANAVADGDLKSGIFATCMQRLQLLSNLKSIAEGAGRKSRLASSLRAAEDEPSRIALVTRLFGSTIAPHWAPSDAREVVLEFREEIATDPVGVLRDASGKYSAADRQEALYVLLARNSSLTSSQDVWLSELIESLLAG